MAAMTMIFVLTAEPVALSGEAWAAAAAALGATGAKGEGAGTTAKLDLGDGVDLVAGAMPAAVPGLAEEGPRSVLWPDAETALAAHRGHVVVVAKGEDAIVARRALALAGTALALAVGAPGLVWADQSWLVATPMARATLEAYAGELPVPLCVGVDLARLADGQLSALSRGMAPLGHPDLWFSSHEMDVGELVETVWMVAAWLISTGTVLREGETIGRDADEKLPVRRVLSPTGSGEEVVAVSYP
jgi:hypothetical protein